MTQDQIENKLTDAYTSQNNFNFDISALVTGFFRLIKDINLSVSVQSKLVLCAVF